ncbi:MULTISPECIES: alpha/beta fold hydrolase [Paraliobacillus]|uniref:alpha/beta fold hydrolase n=1 Tax=Paraliobacillus TaxID=200903 RepID=UPI000DD4C523|nr:MULTISPECIES: alpha/beta fold hydrolase [Paraliobacillus]
MQKFISKRSKLVSILIVIFSFTCLALVYSNPIQSKDTSEITPTLFIHGFKGGPSSFQNMLTRLEEQKVGSKTMVIRVLSNGELSISGNLTEKENPFVQVIFQENRASINQQTEWVHDILHRLYDVYGIQQVNLVGHSMGGLTATNFILTNTEEAQTPSIQKLVVIGSPFKGIDQANYFLVNSGEAAVDLKTQSSALEELIKNKHYFNSQVPVLAIAGVINETDTDGLVSLSSALGIEDIVQEKQMQKEIFYDETATHSGLHEHTGVDKVVVEFLWE